MNPTSMPICAISAAPSTRPASPSGGRCGTVGKQVIIRTKANPAWQNTNRKWQSVLAPACTVVLLCWKKGKTMNQQTYSRLFPLGSHLCREPMPSMAEMKRDMALLKKQGFNLIKLQEHWMTDEPAEGRLQFERYEELISHAASLELGIYLGFTCEQAPHWLYVKHPDCRMVGRNGLPIIYEAPTTLPADGKPGACFDHPGAMADQLALHHQDGSGSRQIRECGGLEYLAGDRLLG